MRARRCGAAIAAVAMWAVVGAPSALALPAPIYPQDGVTYPLGTTVTGDCAPEEPLPQEPAATFTELQRSHFETELYLAAQSDMIGRIYPTDSPQSAGAYDGPCKAETGLNGNTNQAFSTQEHGGTIQPRINGEYQMRLVEWQYRYFSDAENDVNEWSQMPDAPLQKTHVVKNFRMYNPCAYEVTSVQGRAVYGPNGRPPKHVKVGTVLQEGDTLTVGRDGKTRGRVRVSGSAGNNLGIGEGEYQLSDSEACEKLFQDLAPVADGPLPIKVKEGSVTQEVGNQVDSTIEAGKNLIFEGTFSNFDRGDAAGPGITKYEVTRSAKRKRTKACALMGQLRVYTTARGVPPAKRELILSGGECALTKDGGAPRLIR